MRSFVIFFYQDAPPIIPQEFQSTIEVRLPDIFYTESLAGSEPELFWFSQTESTRSKDFTNECYVLAENDRNC